MIARGDTVKHKLGNGTITGQVIAYVAGPGVQVRVRWSNGRVTVARQEDLEIVKLRERTPR